MFERLAPSLDILETFLGYGIVSNLFTIPLLSPLMLSALLLLCIMYPTAQYGYLNIPPYITLYRAETACPSSNSLCMAYLI